MSCSKQHSPAVFLKFIKETTGVDITQSEWHEIKQLAKTAGYDVSKTRASGADAKRVLDKLATENILFRLTEENSEDAVVNAHEKLFISGGGLKAVITQGTVGNMDYLADNGVGKVLKGIRDRKAAEKAAGKSKNQDDSTSENIRFLLADSEGAQLRVAAASPAPEYLVALASSTSPRVRLEVASNRMMPVKAARLLVNDENVFVQRALASNWKAPADVLITLTQSDDTLVRVRVAGNLSASRDVQIWLEDDYKDDVWKALLDNPSIAGDVKERVALRARRA